MPDIFTRRAALGISECEHALKLDRNLATAHSAIGLGKIFIGCAEETEAHIVEALRLSPHDMWAYAWMHILGLAKLHLGSYEQAIEALLRSIQANRNYPFPNFLLAAAYAQLGLSEEASSAGKAGLELSPTFTISHARTLWTARSDHATYITGLERILIGLREAQIPEQ